MYPQGISRSSSSESTAKKSNRILYILGFIEFIFISICLLLLLLNQYLNAVVDDYSPAYKIPDDDDMENTKTVIISSSTTPISEATSKTFDPTDNATMKISSTTQPQGNQSLKILSPTTQSQEKETPKIILPTTTPSREKQTSQILLPTMHPLSTKNPTTDVTIMSYTTDIKGTRGSDTAGFSDNHSNTNIDNNLDTDESKHKRRTVKKSELNNLNTKTEGKDLRMNNTIMESAMESSNPKQKQDWMDPFVSNLNSVYNLFVVKRDANFTAEKHKHDTTTTKLTHLLVMYPSCVSAMIILWMQMISRLTNDIMFKSTMIILIATCIMLGTTLFAASVIESLSQRNSITILIAVSSAVFIILEVVDFILLFVKM